MFIQAPCGKPPLSAQGHDAVMENSTAQTLIAFVGCGFVADYYMTTLANRPHLSVCQVWDQDAARLAQFCGHYGLTPAPSFDAVLGGPAAIIVNLTTPESHFALNMAALAAGKHVYCEKPLAMRQEELGLLVDAAAARGLTLCAAPANALSQAADAAMRLLAGGAVGAPRLVYAEMEDGPVFRENWRDWRSASGAPWPGAHEFEIGCTLEHAGYALTWLIRLFGPVRDVAAASACAYPDKGVDVSSMAADFSVAVLTFDNGVTARLTCGLTARRDRSLTIHGTDGILAVDDLWDETSTLRTGSLGGRHSLLDRVMTKVERWRGKANAVSLPVLKRHGYPTAKKHLAAYPSQIDFMAGVAAQAEMIAGGAPALFEGPVAAHVSEVALAIQAGERAFRPRFQDAAGARLKAASMMSRSSTE